MHILISAQSYPTAAVPFSAFIAVFAEELTRQGHDVTVIAPQSISSHIKNRIPFDKRYYEYNIDNKAEKQIKVYRPYTITLGRKGLLYRISVALCKFSITRALKHLKRNNFDIVYAHFWWSAYFVIDYVKDNHLPLFVASGEDTINIDNILKPEIIDKIRSMVSGVVCVSSKNVDECIKHNLADKSDCIMIPNAADTNLFRPLDKKKIREQMSLSEKDFVVAFCGRFCHRKGTQRVVQAINLINDDNIKTIFIGNPSEGQASVPNCKGIIYCGSLPHEKIPIYLNCANVFILPTLAEGCPNSVIEALACGIPVISSDLPFNYDILNDSNSILVNPLDIKEIANAILKIKNNPSLEKALSLGALEARRKLSIKSRVSKIVDFIQSRY